MDMAEGETCFEGEFISGNDFFRTLERSKTRSQRSSLSSLSSLAGPSLARRWRLHNDGICKLVDVAVVGNGGGTV